jgi:hypothetical protein
VPDLAIVPMLVGGVRDQLAEKDLLVRVQRMDHQVEELPGFGLKLQGLDGCRGHGKVLLVEISSHADTEGREPHLRTSALAWGIPPEFLRVPILRTGVSGTF